MLNTPINPAGQNTFQAASGSEANKTKAELTTSQTIRQTVLEEARQCVMSRREAEYGPPEDNLASVAELWSSYLSTVNGFHVKVGVLEVAQLMVLLKVARSASGLPKMDTFVDQAGYSSLAAIGAFMAEPIGKSTPEKGN